MKQTTINRYLLSENIKIVCVSLLALYVISLCMLFLACWNNLSTGIQKDMESVEKQLSEFITPYKKLGHEINDSQSLLRHLTHVNISSGVEPEQAALPQTLSVDGVEVYSRVCRVYPSYADETADIPESGPKLCVQGDTLVYIMPVQNFIATEAIGSIVQQIEPTLLASHLDRTLPSNISVTIYDANGELLYSRGEQFAFKRVETLTAGVSGQVSADIGTYVQLIALYIILTLPLIFAIFLLAYRRWKRTSEKILQPIQLLLHTIQASRIGGQRPRLAGSGFEEIDTLFDSYEQFMDTTERLVSENYKMSLLVTETKLDVLQQSINPHFLFNTLEIISGQSMLEGAPIASRLIQQLGKIFRYNLRAPDIVTLGQELDHAATYFHLRNACINYRVNLKVDVDTAVLGIHMPKLTLQPIIENAFQHAFATEQEHMLIRISSACEGNTVVISIRDNGSGIGEERLAEIRSVLLLDHTDFRYFTRDRKHIGLRNVSEKVNIMFHTDDALTVDSRPGEGTCVMIRLPLEGRDDNV